jgi:hypothetical protein
MFNLLEAVGATLTSRLNKIKESLPLAMKKSKYIKVKFNLQINLGKVISLFEGNKHV